MQVATMCNLNESFVGDKSLGSQVPVARKKEKLLSHGL